MTVWIVMYAHGEYSGRVEYSVVAYSTAAAARAAVQRIEAIVGVARQAYATWGFRGGTRGIAPYRTACNEQLRLLHAEFDLPDTAELDECSRAWLVNVNVLD